MNKEGQKQQNDRRAGISFGGNRDENSRMKAFKKSSVGGGGDLRRRIKVGVKCRYD